MKVGSRDQSITLLEVAGLAYVWKNYKLKSRQQARATMRENWMKMTWKKELEERVKDAMENLKKS